jgi:UvrD/REP helicase N-terminal domain
MMASRSTDIIPNAWDALAGRLTPAQREAAMRPGSALVLAGAGTGKTSTLTASVVHKIEVEKLAASRLLVVTFTNKAPTASAPPSAMRRRRTGSGRFTGSARDSFAPRPKSQAFVPTSTSSTPMTAAG